MNKSLRILICASGVKGLNFLENIIRKWSISAVISYPQPNVTDDAYNAICHACETNNIKLVQATRPSLSSLEPFDLCFVIGWQYLFPEVNERVIVFHDSLLPKYRGYSPTVAALLAGDKHIGVTALLPNGTMDGGVILAQEAIDIEYPITIGTAFEKLSACYSILAERIIVAAQNKKLVSSGKPQDDTQATYSIWRDHNDQKIDWTKDSGYIERFVNALTWPYTGARTLYEGQEIIVQAAYADQDITFVERHPGKLWNIHNNQPVIICGNGMLRITSATTTENVPVTFSRIRTRCK